MAVSCLAILFWLAGCSDEDPTGASEQALSADGGLLTAQTVSHGDQAPAGLVDVTWQGQSTRCWPYTGRDFSGAPQDPINLIFVGEVDAVQIRAALMSLDGDRSAWLEPEIPLIPPFTETWSDALGEAQVGYAESDGWIGTVVQLQLGTYEALRFHVRLIECTEPFGAGGRWTLANAHFDMLIPNTADHEVISWELAEYIVVVDLVRSGLLHPSSLPVPSQTGVITQTPSFREIPQPVYDGMPIELKALCGLLDGPELPNDGKATILHVAGTVPVEPGTAVQEFTLNYGLLVPMPFCNDGPLDYIFLDGPVAMEKTVRVDAFGRYQYTATFSGHLTATPMDVLQDPPLPAAEAFKAIVHDEQRGILDANLARLSSDIKRVGPQRRGVEKQMTTLRVSSNGDNIFRLKTQCLGPDQ
jgi:hypothetical protein